MRYPVYRSFSDEIRQAVTWVLIVSGVLYLLMIGLSEGKVNFDLGALLSTVFLISACPLSAIALIVLVRIVRKRQPKISPLLPPEHLYAITTHRAILYSLPYLSTTSVALDHVEVVFEPLKRKYGSIKFYPYSKKLAPAWNSFPQRTPIATFIFNHVPNAVEVYQLAREAQTALRDSS